MGEVRDENYITEMIFIPIYNRSATFRKWVSAKFGKDFGDSINFTGDDGKRSSDNEYGFPDATSNLGNFIEVKTKLYTQLQLTECRGGKDGRGYEKYLKDNNDKLLLYVVPREYDLSNAVQCGDRVQTIIWDEIIDFLREQNNSDPMIEMIYNKVDNVEVEKVKTVESYKAKVYEVLTRVCALNGAISINLDGEDPFTTYPEKMEDSSDHAEIDFSFGDGKGQILFYKTKIWIYIPIDRKGYDDILKKYGFKYFEEENDYQMEVISQDEFWKKDAEELALIFNSYILRHQSAWNEIYIKQNYEYPLIFESKVKPVFERIAKKYGFELDDETAKEGRFLFNDKLWCYGFEFDNADWGDFFYGIVYYDKGGSNLSKKQREALENLLEKFTDNTAWYPTWKYADEPYRNWNEETFNSISKNPAEFEEFIESKLSEITKALKKAELI